MMNFLVICNQKIKNSYLQFESFISNVILRVKSGIVSSSICQSYTFYFTVIEKAFIGYILIRFPLSLILSVSFAFLSTL